jgi:hypothetical protein
MAASTEIAQAFASFKLGNVALSGSRPETMRCMDATEVSPTARRAVVNVGGRFHCTERARNGKMKKAQRPECAEVPDFIGF